MHLRLLAVAVVLAAVAGCGGDDPDDVGASPATTLASAPSDAARLRVVEDGLDAATTEELNAAAETAFAGSSTPGAVMAVRTSKGTWVATIGTKDLDGTEAMTADVRQRIGSITKTFTVTALLQLVDEGALTLDDPIGDYVDGMPDPDATLGELAAMRSGIPSYTFDKGWQDAVLRDPTAEWTPEQLIDIVRGQEPDFAPGEQTSYSNTNTILLGLVLEDVTGKPIDQVIEERIIETLGLTATVFPTDASFADPHARGYTVQGQADRVPVDATDWTTSWGWTAGAMVSDVNDLLVYGKELVAGDVLLSPEMQRERIDSFDFEIPPNSPARAYGYGLGLANGWYGHTGELFGYNTVLQHHLDEDITVVVMANSDIRSGDCPSDTPTVPGGRTEGPCADPAVYIADGLTAALGLPLVEPPTTTDTTDTTD